MRREEGLPVVPLEWIIASKRAANREKDRRDMPLLEEFLKVWKSSRRPTRGDAARRRRG